jgi:hypothetical protein
VAALIFSTRPPAKRSDNGRLSGTSVGERLDGEPHGAQHPYVDLLARTLGFGSDGFMNMSLLVQANDNPWRGDWLLRRVNIQSGRQPDIGVEWVRTAMALLL